MNVSIVIVADKVHVHAFFYIIENHLDVMLRVEILQAHSI